MKKLLIFTIVILLSLAFIHGYLNSEPVKGDILETTTHLNVRTEPCTSASLIVTLPPGSHVKFNGQTRNNCGYVWYNISGSFKSGWAAKNWLKKVEKGSVNHKVEMVHQRWDTQNEFNGSWACGPTSAVMALTFWNKLKKHPIIIDFPHRHSNDYGFYVSNKFYAPDGFYFNRAQNDASGKPAWGAYGHCTENGMAWAWRIQQFIEHFGLKTKFYDAATFSEIKNAIDTKKLVVLSTRLTASGHIILVKGYDTEGYSLYANDPWGNANLPQYGKLYNGANVKYSWEKAKPKWMVVVWNPAEENA